MAAHLHSKYILSKGCFKESTVAVNLDIADLVHKDRDCSGVI